MQLVDIPRRRPQRRVDLLDGAEIEQLPQLLDAHQLAQQVAIERERLRAPLLGRRVVLVHVRRDVVEEERGRERRRRRGLHLDDRELARLDPLQDPAERRQVEDVLQALPEGLEHDRELRVAARDLQQALRLQALLPERRPLAGPAARDEQRPRGVLPEPRAEQRRLRELAEEQLLDLVGVEQEVGERRRRVGVGEVERDAVVRPDRLHVESERVAQPSPPAPSTRARAPVRRTATGRRRASRRSRRGTARRRSSGRTERHRSRPPARAGTSRGSSRQAHRGGTPPRAARSRRRRRAPTSSREARPIFSPSSAGRPTPSPFQNGAIPGTPGAGETSTRSRVMSSIRQVEAPRTKVWPSRASYTISSSSSPTRPPPSTRKTPKSPRSGIVPAFVTASRLAPVRPRIVPAVRSQTMRGRSSANSSDG